jgi:hypothetical protein
MNQTAYNTPGTDPYLEPERTSLAAIMGFIFSLVGCCLGVTALLGAPLSIIGMINVGRSNGRLGGRGLAVAGLLISLLNLAVWGGCVGAMFVGLGQVPKMVFEPMDTFFAAMKDGDFDAARAVLGPPASNATDEELTAFYTAYTTTLGDFTGRPAGLGEYFSSFAEFGPWGSVMGGRQNAIPVLVEFESGKGMVIWQMPQGGPGGPTEIIIFDGALNEYTLPMQPGWESADTSSAPAEEAGSTDEAAPGEEPSEDPDAPAP